MAWIEQTGKTSWRVRYLRDDGTCGSESGFHTRKAAEDYAHDLDSDRRRGTWLRCHLEQGTAIVSGCSNQPWA
jgi:hypothetical protein